MYPHPIKSVCVLGLSIVALGIAGCALNRAVSKAEPTSFLHSTGTAGAGTIGRLPFERSWRNPSVKTSNYSRIVLRPVTTAYLRTENWEQSVSPFITNERDFVRGASDLAHFWDQSLRTAFGSPKNRFSVVGDASQPGTLVVEIALTEVVFGRPTANAASYAVSGGGVAFAAMFAPSVAFEARVTDGATGQLIATASDRRGTKIKVLDLSKFTFTESNKQICDQWSQEFVQAFNRSLFPQVKRAWFGVF